MAFVRSTNVHPCPGVPCGASVRNVMYACRVDWARLPQEHKAAIRDTAKLSILNPTRRGALIAAGQWYRDNPRGGEST